MNRNKSKIIFAAIFALIFYFLTISTPGGSALLKSYQNISQNKLSAWSRVTVDVEFIPTRFNPLSIIYNDIVLWIKFKPIEKNTESKHDTFIIRSESSGFGTKCKIFASAQSFDIDQPLGRGLAKYINDRNILWSYSLGHEMAHCYWSAKLEYADYKLRNPSATIYDYDQEMLVEHIGESYADAYSVLNLIHNTNLERGTISSIARWRYQSFPANSPHMTSMAILYIFERSSDSAQIFEKYSDVHRTAILASIFSARSWLKKKNYSDQEIERRILNLLPMMHVLPGKQYN